MPVYKTTWFFEGFQPTEGVGGTSAVGWTETWYQTAADLETAINVGLATGANSYAALRLACLPAIYQMTWVRVSDIANPRATKTGAINLLGRFTAAVAADAAPGQITCALLVDFTVMPGVVGPVAHHRRFLLRGLTTSVTKGNVVNPGASQLGPITRFLDLLGRHEVGSPPHAPPASPWMMLCNNSPAAAFNINALVPTPGNAQNIDVSPAGGVFAVGTRVLIKGVKFPRGVNRIWTVYNSLPGPPNVVTLKQSRFLVAGAFQPSGTIQVLAQTPAAPTQYLRIGLRERKTGRPSRATRGRRRAA